MPINKLTTLIDKIIEFYDTHRWARYALYDGRGFCVLGAASAVLTNEAWLIDKYNPKFQLAQPLSDFKGIDILKKFSDEYRKEMKINSLVGMNDSATGKRQVIANLKKFRKLIV